jgi:GAF domain-containing protein
MPLDAGEDDAVMHVAEMFGEVARSLAAHEDLQTTLEKIVLLAVEHLESCEYAGISFVEGRRITSPASSDEVPRIVDAIQTEVDEGPCLDAIKEHEVFLTGDLKGEERWPRFSHRAHAETGIQSILSLRLFLEEQTMGALNLYSSEPDAFDQSDEALGSVFAAHAAVALSNVRREHDLERKAESRDVIGKAIGILMARSAVGEGEAFDMLRRASQRLNTKLVQVADHIVHPVHEAERDAASN